MRTDKFIQVVGARQHNLKDISVRVPRSAFTVITGLSGSGKSSLAFDTIYAEGERRYVESLSAHARQFLEQMPKPDVDRIEGLSPTVAIEQRATVSNPRSTVATTTEIYDYLRVLFARAGQPTCWVCGKPIVKHSVSEIVDAVLSEPEGARIMVLAPLDLPKRTDFGDVIERVAKQGFVRVRANGKVYDIDDAPMPTRNRKYRIEVVVDRLILRDAIRPRLADSIELALSVGEGWVIGSIGAKSDSVRDLIFSNRYSCPKHRSVSLQELSPRMFSFNSPYGACNTCNGLGTVPEFDAELIVPDGDVSLANGAVAAWRHGGKRMNAVYGSLVEEFCRHFAVSPKIRFRNIPEPLTRILLNGTTEADARTYGVAFEGVIPNLQRRWKTTDSEAVKQRLHRFLSDAPCEACGGNRLRPEALAVKIGDKSISDVCRLNVAEADRFFASLELKGERARIADQPLREIRHRLKFMCDVGVQYLALSRTSSTLSRGEAQRIRLATQIGGGLVGVCYILDEPTIGLHQRDTGQLVSTLKRLVRSGNTVLVVEHDEEVIAAADHVIDIGPGAGADGGEVVVEGTLNTMLKSADSVTAKYLTGRYAIPVPPERRKIYRSNAIEIRGARENNLKNITVRFPVGCFVCVTGVSGSGKSTLVSQILLRALHRRISGTGPRPGAHDQIVGASRVDRVIEIDQSPIGRTPRSNPATYVGVFDHIRWLYARTREAKIRGFGASRFSFNVKGGRCEDCQGQGTKRIEMHFLPDVFVECGACKGTRYNRETLEVRYRGRSIADVLDLRVEEATAFFMNFPKIKRPLRALMDVGLGYVKLGQSSTTLSGGEAQRVKLAAELGKSAADHTLYVLDEPTTGLHFADIHKLLNVLNRLTAMGHTIIVIEHNLDVIKVADWIIDLGPEGGDAGGYIVTEGTPEDVAANKKSYTGRYLKARLNGRAPLESALVGRSKRRGRRVAKTP